MNGSSLDLAGVLIPAVTPFDPVTGDVDLVAVRSNVRAWIDQPVLGVVMAGSTGEAVFLDESERRVLVEGVRDVLPADRLLVAGTGAESTRATIRLTKQAADIGVDAVLVMPPAYYRSAMTPEVLRTHFEAVAEASPVPVILYQVPLRFSTLDLATGLVVELSRHENVVGIKDSRGDLELVGVLADQCASGFQVLVGNGAALYASLELGAVGGVLGVANLAPGACAEMVAAFRRGEHERAGRLQERVGPVHQEVVAGMGVPGVKAGLDLLELHGGAPRPPLRPVDEGGRRRVEEALRGAGLLPSVDTPRAPS